MYFDIGANVGRWALENIKSLDHKIICVEASPTTFSRLLDATGGSSKIECLNYAVCNNAGQDITFYHCSDDVLSTLNKEWLTSKMSRFYNRPFSSITCRTITIDALIMNYGIPELIKIDVEGGEYHCISSLTGANGVPRELCFEWASELNDVTFKCIDHLVTLGFSTFHLQNEDHYDYRPAVYDCTVDDVKALLSSTTPKVDWGMVWCRQGQSLTGKAQIEL